MKFSKTLLSLTLVLSLIGSLFSGYLTTSAAAALEPEPEIFNPPDIVDAAEAAEHGYVGRVEAAETDLYTFVFKNADGSNTMRVYSHPVKYVDEAGKVRDISLSIGGSQDGFVSVSHAVKTAFGFSLADGISLAYNEVDIRLLPAADGKAKLSSNGKQVTYAVDDVTSYVYSLTYAGFKEDIVVAEYTGQTEYEFTLLTGGLAVKEKYGSFFLVDDKDEVQATLGDIIIFTADERNNTLGEMTVEEVKENEEYVLTIHLDPDWLADERTLYPITIDPTVETVDPRT